ncbi:MAG: hypothetical protein MUO78_05450, partial [candidate division Zixibacteria bacterium]|nr:hypothetical protein [candidate division Zixibacteria bacterium]
MAFEVPDITPELIIQASEAVFFHGRGCTVPFVKQFLDLSDDYTSRALKGAQQLKLIEEKLKTGKQINTPVNPICKYLVRANKIEKTFIFRLQLEEFEPFAFFKTRLSVNVDPVRAAQETNAFYNLKSNVTLLKQILTNWGTFAGSLKADESKGGALVVSSSSLNEPFKIIFDITNKTVAIQTYILGRVGLEAGNFIRGEILDN